MDKLSKILFNVSLGLVLVLSAAVLAGFIIMGCIKLAHYIDKMF